MPKGCRPARERGTVANIFICDGNLGQRVEVKYTKKGFPIAEFTICNTLFRKEGKKPNWIRFKALGEVAKNLEKFTDVGYTLHIIAELQVEHWETEDGKRVRQIPIVREVQWYSKKRKPKKGDGDGPQEPDVEDVAY